MKKKWGIAVFVFCMMCLFDITLSADETRTDDGKYVFITYKKADMDNNGYYSLRDALGVLMQVAGVEKPEDDMYADINLDEKVDVSDAKHIMDMYLKHGIIEGTVVYKRPDDECTIIVDDNAMPTENYSFISCVDAISYINANPATCEEERYSIYIAPGFYLGVVNVESPYVSMYNMNSDEKVTLSSYYCSGYNYASYYGGTKAVRLNSAPIEVTKYAHDFIAYDIYFENSYNLRIAPEEAEDSNVKSTSNTDLWDRIAKGDHTLYQRPALAARILADRVSFYNCSFVGRQDTLLVSEPGRRSYFKDCYIEGTVDFIFGDGTAVFDSCKINCPYAGGYVTAASTDINTEYGFLFKDCVIEANATDDTKTAPENGSYSLGRPWRENAMVIYWNCKMSDCIKTNKDRFCGMAGEPENARFFEVGSMDLDGNLLELEKILTDMNLEAEKEPFEILSQEDMIGDGKYSIKKWLSGDDGWNPGKY